ncbi:MAG TPA: sensor domain-containing diguanylate cyclase [Acidobacteriaceae bacterium]|jgi:diguanylate cyclase (GGDEF)-like protein|nr:sensor domain-containing diguanylate cyclase [Acidobacteriaceae bacterium]
MDSRQMDHLRVFHEVARALTANLELEPLLRAILSQMEEYFGPEQWSLLMLDEEAGELYYALHAGINADNIADLRIKLGEGISGYVAVTGNPLVVPDVSVDPDWSRFARQHPELHLQSIACLPIRHGGRTLGVLQLHNSKLDLLPDSSISFLRVLCDYAAIALANARYVKLVQHLSITDDCTGLFNARYLYTSLESEIAAESDPRVIPIQPHFSLLFLDLDRFKSVNDTHGHLVGSRLLAEVGGVIKRAIGPNHAGFRYGGDEFVVLMRGLDKPAAVDLANRLQDQLRANDFLSGEGLSLKLTASFGLATYPQDGDTLHSIIRSADTMMYHAKARGRDQIAVADASQLADMPAPKTSRHA